MHVPSPRLPIYRIRGMHHRYSNITKTPQSGCLSLFLCSAQNRTHLRDNVRADLQKLCSARGSHTSPRSARGIAVARRYMRVISTTSGNISGFCPAHRIPRPLLCRISSARYTRLNLLATRDIASQKNSYQLFFSHFHTKIPIGLTPSGFFSYSLVTCIKRGTRHGAK